MIPFRHPGRTTNPPTAMNATPRTHALALLLALLVPMPATFGQNESTEDLVKKLKGQAGSPATRGIRTRGGGAAPASETRSLILNTRGIPKAIQAAAEEEKVDLKQTTAPASTGAGELAVTAGEPAVELNYQVDPQSKVIRDNILFRKGSADFVDDASVAVVVSLSQALKHPDLEGLQFVIEGHASAEGGSDPNQTLSQARAERIVSVLTSLGVETDRLLPVGFGETKARFPEDSPEGLLRQDRRVLIFRLDK